MDFSVKTASLAGALIFLVVYISFKRSESWEPTDSSATPAVGAAAAGGGAQHEARYIFDINDPFSKSFVDNFEAANPAYTEDCKAYMRSPQEFNQERKSYMNWKYYFSQWQQDYVMFINVFFDMAARGKKGFYIESGAHDYIRVSNTAFLDLCLGWEGLCIEPQLKYHKGLKQHRTCKLKRNCVSDQHETLKVGKAENMGEAGSEEVECLPVSELLDEQGVTDVTLWSLDVEGFEAKALKGIDLEKYNVDTLIIEDQVCNPWAIDWMMTRHGYSKYLMVSDAFYTKVKLDRLIVPDPDIMEANVLQTRAHRKQCAFVEEKS